MILKFAVLGRAVPKERPRFGAHGVVYTPTRTVEYEQGVADAFIEAAEEKYYPDIIYEGPVMVTVVEYRRIPLHTSRFRRQAMAAGDIEPIKRPDVDNVVKSVLDGLQKAEAFKDDAQVVDLHVIKRYCDNLKHPEPEVEIQVTYLMDLDHDSPRPTQGY